MPPVRFLVLFLRSFPRRHSVPDSSPLVFPALLLGDFTHPEFQEVVSVLRGAVLHQRLQEAETLRAARDLYPPGRQPPELVVICQTWSDQFSADEIQGLIAWLPFARILCCFGPWCDSDGRTRDLWPLAVRIPAAEAVSAVAATLRELQVPVGLGTGSPGSSLAPLTGGSGKLPLTASRAEIYAARYALPVTGSLQSLAVAVNSPDRAWREMIEKLVRSRQGEVLPGSLATVPSVPRPPHWLVWDADPAGPARHQELDQWRQACPRLRVLACVGFPRQDQALALRQQGVDAVWPKLAPLADLVELLARDARRK
jgi:hypothetical protein